MGLEGRFSHGLNRFKFSIFPGVNFEEELRISEVLTLGFCRPASPEDKVKHDCVESLLWGWRPMVKDTWLGEKSPRF